MGDADSIDIGTIYCIYDDQGNYVDGDLRKEIEFSNEHGLDKDSKEKLSELNQEKAELDDKLGESSMLTQKTVATQL